MSVSIPSYLKTYLSAAYNMPAMHDEYAVDCTMLGRNVLTQNPKPKS